MACQWPTVYAAVESAARTALGTTVVHDGEPTTSDRLETAVIIGRSSAVGDDDTAGLARQGYRDLGSGASRDETGEIRCCAVAQRGDDDLSAARTAAWASIATIETALRANPSLGLAQLLRIELVTGVATQGRSPDGVWHEIPFTLAYTALI